MKITSLAELDSLRQKLKEELRLREQQEGIKVSVSMGTCGIAAGARDVVMAMLEELQKRGVANVTVTQKGCVGMCHCEPLVEVEMPSGEKFVYGFVDGEKARRIVVEHLINGRVVNEWIIGD